MKEVGAIDDAEAMGLALSLADAAAGTTWPNPTVGCVIVADDEVVGRGVTSPPPGPHAEVHALDEAGSRARGATAYVTLEPCAHEGRTPPCVTSLLHAGIGRVVVAVADPHPLAAGGAAQLAAAGVSVRLGVGEDRAREQLAGFLRVAATGRPAIMVKLALSIDGRIAAADGTSQWLTSEATRSRAHALRAAVDGVVVGSGTVLADDPSLTVRLSGSGRLVDWVPPGLRQPMRVVLDRRARTDAAAQVYDASAPSLAVVGRTVDAGHLARAGVEVVTVDAAAGDGGLTAAYAAAAARGCRSLLVEGGAQVAGATLAAGLADRLIVHLAPVLLGDEGRAGLACLPVPTLEDAPRWRLESVETLAGDALLTYVPALTAAAGGGGIEGVALPTPTLRDTPSART